MIELENNFYKISGRKNKEKKTENQCENAASEQKNH